MSEIQTIQTEFATLGCAQLYDAAPQYCHVVDMPLQSRTHCKRFAARAHTVVTNNDMLPCIAGLADVLPGWALVIDNTADESEALAGDIFFSEAVKKQVAAIVVNGAIRDIDYIQAMDICGLSQSVTYVSAKTAVDKEIIESPSLNWGGVEINHGDWLFGDSDGLLLVKQESISAVITAAKILRMQEHKLMTRIQSGESLDEIIGLRAYLAGTSDKLLSV